MCIKLMYITEYLNHSIFRMYKTSQISKYNTLAILLSLFLEKFGIEAKIIYYLLLM